MKVNEFKIKEPLQLSNQKTFLYRDKVDSEEEDKKQRRASSLRKLFFVKNISQIGMIIMIFVKDNLALF